MNKFLEKPQIKKLKNKETILYLKKYTLIKKNLIVMKKIFTI